MQVLQSKSFRVFVLLLALLAGMLVFIATHPGPGNTGDRVLAPVPEGGDFVLQSADGPVSLKDFRGKVVLLYFGYTLCPDICPTTLSTVAAALKQLPPAAQDQVRVIFVSVDPKRDTPQRLKQYTQYFHHNMIGVTGEKKVIDDIVRRYGAIYRIVDDGSSAGYLVDHSSTLYLIDQNGKLTSLIPHGATADEVAKRVLAQLKRGAT